MAEHSLTIKAKLDASDVQRQLDLLNSDKNSSSDYGMGGSGNYTHALRQLEQTMRTLTRTIQQLARSMARGMVGPASAANLIAGAKRDSATESNLAGGLRATYGDAYVRKQGIQEDRYNKELARLEAKDSLSVKEQDRVDTIRQQLAGLEN